MAQFQFLPLSRIQPVEIRWLWHRRLPRGKLAMLDGDPGVGKSLVTLDIAARLSRGAGLPDGTETRRPHTTLLLAAEDDAAGTNRPRAEAAHADLERVVTISAEGGLPQFPRDFAAFEELVAATKPDLVVFDPVMSFLDANVVANTEQCVRRVLGRLADLAERHDAAILMVRHLRKANARKAWCRGIGSVGFIASVRTGLLAAQDPADPSRNILAITKTNLSDPPPSLAYRVVPDGSGRPTIEWLGPAEPTADELYRKPEEPLRLRDQACHWLQQFLANGPVIAAEVYAAAAEAGIPDRTLERARATSERGRTKAAGRGAIRTSGTGTTHPRRGRRTHRSTSRLNCLRWKTCEVWIDAPGGRWAVRGL